MLLVCNFAARFLPLRALAEFCFAVPVGRSLFEDCFQREAGYDMSDLPCHPVPSPSPYPPMVYHLVGGGLRGYGDTRIPKGDRAL